MMAGSRRLAKTTSPKASSSASLAFSRRQGSLDCCVPTLKTTPPSSAEEALRQAGRSWSELQGLGARSP